MASHPLGLLVAVAIVALASSHASAQIEERKLNPPLVAGGDVQAFKVAPRPERPRRVRRSSLGPARLERRVVYRADADVDEVVELYSVLDSGGPVVKLNGPLVAGGDVTDVEFSPDGTRVVYAADAIQDGVYELFSVPADGSSAPVKLNGPLVVGGNVGYALGLLDSALAFTPDGSYVVYRADQEIDEVEELFRVPIEGSAPPVKLSVPAEPGGDVNGFTLSPDGTFVVYLAEQPGFGSGMFRAPSDGSSAPVQFSVGEEPAYFHGFRIVSSGTHVVSHTDASLGHHLYRAPSDASVPGSLLTGTVPGHVAASRFDAACQRMLFLVSNSIYSELYSMPVDGSTNPVALCIPSNPYGEVQGHEISPDGTRAVYRADAVTDERVLLYGVPAGGGSSIELNGPIPAGGDVSEFSITPDGTRVVYLADESVNNRLEIYSVPIAGGSNSVRLNAALPAGRNVTRFLVAPDGKRVAWVADQNADEVFELFLNTADGSLGSIQVNDPLVGGGDVILGTGYSAGSVRFNSDGTRLLYRADADADEVFELYASHSFDALGL